MTGPVNSSFGSKEGSSVNAEVTGNEPATWDGWDPKAYLRDYYSLVEPDEIETISFLAGKLKNFGEVSRALVYGCGPTLHHVFALTPHAAEIHLADYIPANLDEIKNWKDDNGQQHDWKDFVKYTLECEQGADTSELEISQREAMTRNRITKLLQTDAGNTMPLGEDGNLNYPLVISCYCADSATSDKVTWEKYMRNITSLVARGGVFITAALRESSGYKVGENYFPSANVTEHDMRRVLNYDFVAQSINIGVRDLPEHRAQGYSGIILAIGVKK